LDIQELNKMLNLRVQSPQAFSHFRQQLLNSKFPRATLISDQLSTNPKMTKNTFSLNNSLESLTEVKMMMLTDMLLTDQR
jgi:hypothetical protein